MTGLQLVTATKLLGHHKVWVIMSPYGWPVLMLDDGSHINIYADGTSSRYSSEGEFISSALQEDTE